MIIAMGELFVDHIEVRAIGQIFYEQPTHLWTIEHMK